MNSDIFFYKLLNKSNRLHSYCFRHIINSNNFLSEILGWSAAIIPTKIWKSDLVLKIINNTYPIRNVGVLKIDPWKNYKWHVDTYRLVSINMLLSTNHTSHTLFSNNYRNGKDQIDICELEYEPKTFYVFNTREYHTVINFEKERYMLSVEFLQNCQPDYTTLKNFCIENNV